MVACLNSYYELRPCPPKIEKLKHLLNECPYKGPELEEDSELQMDVNEGGDTHDPRPRGAGLWGTEKTKDKPRKVHLYLVEDLYPYVYLNTTI